MTTLTPPQPVQLVYTPAEVAAVLRVTPETIRRKIVSGELGAIEVGGKERKQYRITGHDLSEWLGVERASQLFHLAGGQVALEAAFKSRTYEETEQAIHDAIKAERAQRRHERKGPYLPTPTPEEIAERFKR